MTFDDFLSKLEGVTRKGDRAKARCPVPSHGDHGDQRPSFSVWLTPKGKIGHKCFRGCSETAIDTALGITWKDRMPPRSAVSRAMEGQTIAAEYDYRDETGTLLYQNVRYDPKDFKQRAPDGAGGWKWKMAGPRRVIYKLPELIAAP